MSQKPWFILHFFNHIKKERKKKKKKKKTIGLLTLLIFWPKGQTNLYFLGPKDTVKHFDHHDTDFPLKSPFSGDFR